MSAPGDDDVWLDDDAGALIRPYSVSEGRTRPTVQLDLLSLVIAASEIPGGMDLEHMRVLRLCRRPTSVVELSAHLRLPLAVTKVLLSDLVDCAAVTTRAPRPMTGSPDKALLEKLLDGLQRS